MNPWLLALALPLFAHAQNFPIENGTMEINLNGDTGETAGSVSLTLSYADAAKSAVKIEGSGRYNGHDFSVSQSAPLAQLKKLVIEANGGDGYPGSSGRSGQDGQNGRDGQAGWSGSDGCPPSSGQRGGDGTNGTDGGNGGNGGAGGSGGNGGTVRVTAAADQSELLLLVHASAEAGAGGRGGSGGRAGIGGRGGHGGSGGRGGTNTCKDAQGHPTHGPNGASGWSGNSGRNGSDGRRGYDGPAGADGRSGSFAFVTTDTSGSHEYAKAFHLAVNAVKAIDDNEDGVVEPGEAVHVTEITIANSGPMPTPAGQALSLSFGNTSTLVAKAAPAQSLGVIPGNSVRTLTFAKGQLVFTAPDKTDLLEKDVTLATSIGINSFVIPGVDGTGLGIHWPVGITAAAPGTGIYFGTAKPVAFTIRNVTSRDVGPHGEQPVDVEFAWASKDVPGADVKVVLSDGREVNLAQPVVVSDYTVPAKGTLPLPLTVTIANGGGRFSAAGSLKVSLRLRDESGNGQDLVDSAATAFDIVADFRAVAINRKIDLTGANIYCRFPHRLLQTLQISELDLVKAAGTDKLTMQVARKGFLSDGTSPAHSLGAFDFGPYGSLAHSANPAVVVAFLNRLYAPASQADQATWQMEGGSCAVGHQ